MYLRPSILICLLYFSLFSLQAQHQIKDKSPESLAKLPYNEFILYWSEKMVDPQSPRLLMKYTGRLDSLIARISRFHQKQPEIERGSKRISYKWLDFPQPNWFYANQHLFLEVEFLPNHFLLSFYHAYGSVKPGKLQLNAIKAGFGRLMIDAYEPMINALTYEASPTSPYDYGKNENFYFLSRKELESVGIEQISSYSASTKHGKDGPTDTAIWRYSRLSFAGDTSWYKSGEIEKNKDFEFMLEKAHQVFPNKDSSYHRMRDGKIVFHSSTTYGGSGDGGVKDTFLYISDDLYLQKKTAYTQGRTIVRYGKYQCDSAGRPSYYNWYPWISDVDTVDFSYENVIKYEKRILADTQLREDLDTVYFNYDPGGRYLGWVDEWKEFRSNLQSFDWPIYGKNFRYYQVYIHGRKAEEVIKESTGLLPQTVFLELRSMQHSTLYWDGNIGKYLLWFSETLGH